MASRRRRPRAHLRGAPRRHLRGAARRDRRYGGLARGARNLFAAAKDVTAVSDGAVALALAAPDHVATPVASTDDVPAGTTAQAVAPGAAANQVVPGSAREAVVPGLA